MKTEFYTALVKAISKVTGYPIEITEDGESFEHFFSSLSHPFEVLNNTEYVEYLDADDIKELSFLDVEQVINLIAEKVWTKITGSRNTNNLVYKYVTNYVTNQVYGEQIYDTIEYNTELGGPKFNTGS